MIWQMKEFPVSLTSIAYKLDFESQQTTTSRDEMDACADNISVPDGGCSLSSKDGAVVWQSFGQLEAGCLTILEMAIDDCCRPHSFILEQSASTTSCDLLCHDTNWNYPGFLF